MNGVADTNVVVMLGDSTTQFSLNKPGAKLTDFVQSYITRKASFKAEAGS